MQNSVFRFTFIFLLMSTFITACSVSQQPPMVSQFNSEPSPTVSSSYTLPPTAEPTTVPLSPPKISPEMFGIIGRDKALFEGVLMSQNTNTQGKDRISLFRVITYGEYEKNGKIYVVCRVVLGRYLFSLEENKFTDGGSISEYGLAILTEEDSNYLCESFEFARQDNLEYEDLERFCGPLSDLPSQIHDGLDGTCTFPTILEMQKLYTQATGISF